MGQRGANTAPTDRQVGQHTVIGLDQKAHRIDPPVVFQHPGGGADASLETMADGALARAHIPLVKIRGGGSQGGEDLLPTHAALRNAVEGGVVALPHHGVH